MKVSKTDITDLLIIEPDVYTDERGYFMETYNAEKYAGYGIPAFVQDNESKSIQGVLRGLHYQLPPHGQGKLVRVIEGEVLDVAVDIRPNSPTLGKYVAVTLSAENKKQFWIPAGFAHGFLTLSKTAVFTYKCTAPYNKESERGIHWNDSDIAINWTASNPVVSEKDTRALSFAEAIKEYQAIQI